MYIYFLMDSSIIYIPMHDIYIFLMESSIVYISIVHYFDSDGWATVVKIHTGATIMTMDNRRTVMERSFHIKVSKR